MTQFPIAVFGGTGFLGRRVVRHLLDAGQPVRVVSRHPQRSAELFGRSPLLETAEADIQRPEQVADVLRGTGGAVNAVSLYVERDGATFQSVHVEAAGRLARLAREAGVERLVQLSGIGADPQAPSPYIASRGRGEAAVLQAFPAATIVRPAVMVGEDDTLVVPLAGMLRRFPLFPLFGRGETRLQPAWVEDVAEAVARAARAPTPLLELGGGERLTYRELIEAVGRQIGRQPVLLPVPFAAWQRLAWAAERLPEPPITRNQVELMRRDNVPSGKAPGLPELGIEPQPLGALLPRILGKAG